jgi:outer membrane protein assembly factor BamB/formylglycine-generating enzyme required for sulfatase activity
MGNLPAEAGAVMTASKHMAPTGLVKRDRTTGQAAQPPSRDVGIEMCTVPAGGYFINQDQWHEREVTVSPFEMSTFAVTYRQWARVRHWAEAHGYEFDRSGDLGSCYWSQGTLHTTDEPVTRVSLWDAMVFCNALSAMQGRTPCYYIDPQRARPLRKAFLQRPPRLPPPDYGAPANVVPWVFVNWAADGYRLPTSSEYLSAVSGKTKRLDRYHWGETLDEMDTRIWHMFSRNSDGSWAGKTHGAAETRKTKKSNPLGLYDLVGNVYELSWSAQPGADATRHPLMDLRNPKQSRFWMYGHPGFGHRLRGRGTAFGTSWRWGMPQIKNGVGPGCHQFGGGYRDEAMPDTGFRVVRCKAGTHPVDGKEALEARTVLDFDPGDYSPLEGAAHRYSLQRNAVFPDPGVADSPKLGALFRTPGAVLSSPVVHEGIAYFGARADDDGKGGAFYAVDARTMGLLWTVPVTGGADGSACIADGVVYFGGRNGKLYAVTAGRSGGKLHWAVPTGRDTMDSAPGVAYGTVFVLNGGYGAEVGIKGFRAADGKMAYLYPAHPYGRAAVCLTPQLALCTHTAADSVYAARLRDEMPAWRGKLLSHSRNDVVVSDGTVFAVMGGGMIGGFDKPGQLGAFDLKTGRRLWWRPIEAHVKEHAYSFSSPVVWNGKLFVGMDNGYMHVFDAKTGQPLPWRVRARDSAGRPVAIRTSPSVSAPNGIVYFGAADGVLRALDGRTGEFRWQLPLADGPIESSVWVDGPALYLGTPEGLVRIVSSETE